MNTGTMNEIKRLDLAELGLYSNPRKDLKDIKGLAASIVAAGGILQPLKGFYREVEPGFFKYLVVDGQRRFTSLSLLEQMNEHAELLMNIPFMILPDGMTENEIRAFQILSNEGEPLTPLELGESIVEMASSEKDATIASIAEKLGKSKVYIAELKKLGELPEYIKALIRKGTLSATLVREQMKAGTLDAFIANISENGIEDNGAPSDDISGEISKETKQKVTQKDLNKLNSIKEFKNFCKAFSEVFTNDEQGQTKMKAYEFAKGLINNDFTAEDILSYFTDEKTAKYDTPEKQALRQRANEQTGRTSKGGKTGAGNSDSAVNSNEAGESEGEGGEAAEGATNSILEGHKKYDGFTLPAGQIVDHAGNRLTEPFPEPIEVAANPIEAIKEAAKVGIQNLEPKGTLKTKKDPNRPKSGKEDYANLSDAIIKVKKSAPKKAVEKAAAPKKAVKKTAIKTEPPKKTTRKIGYDKNSGKIAE